MGLDTYAARRPSGYLAEDDLRAFEEADLRLQAGLFSLAPAAFRGKVYNGLIEHITEVSLYNEWLPPDTVAAISWALNRYSPEDLYTIWVNCDPSAQGTIEEAQALQEFFAICASRGLGLVGWW